jgi:DNA-binding transcriptional ArsR family regulator
MDALGDPTRRKIFEAVVSSPSAVGELAERFPVSRSAVSQHLRVLKDAGLVLDRREGTRRIYRADPDAVADMQGYFRAFWDQALAAFADELTGADPSQGREPG